MNLQIQDFVIRLFIALASGSCIGFERQWRGKNAGLRTNTLVAIGAAIFVMLALQLINGNGDPSRIIGQVVTGIGFLGAGVILHQGVAVQGLTTAATIWCSSALGCLAGAGYYLETLIATAFILLVNTVFSILDDWIRKKTENKKQL